MAASWTDGACCSVRPWSSCCRITCRTAPPYPNPECPGGQSGVMVTGIKLGGVRNDVLLDRSPGRPHRDGLDPVRAPYGQLVAGYTVSAAGVCRRAGLGPLVPPQGQATPLT